MPPIAVALSGGVDSAFAAALLHRQGCELIGLTARLMPPGSGGERGCCDEQLARELCALLGIEHYVVDLAPQFSASVMDAFIASYAAGLTPNPCLPCNQLIKFGALFDSARKLGCETLATGHYAIRAARGPQCGLRMARDRGKDQSYMLLGLSPEQVARACFPLGELLKSDVLAGARELRLPFTERESQDVCFVSGSLADFLAPRLTAQPGPILDPEGNALATHRGLPFYTIGQRRGLDIGGSPRLFVLAKDPARNTLIVGPREDLCRRAFRVRETNWISLPPPAPGESLACRVMVRYRGAPIPGLATVGQSAVCSVTLATHDQAIAPGQGAAFYDDEGWLLAGGEIGDSHLFPPFPLTTTR